MLRTCEANVFFSILPSPGRSNRRDGARIEASMGDAASP